MELKVAFNFVTKRNCKEVNIGRHRVGLHIMEEKVEPASVWG